MSLFPQVPDSFLYFIGHWIWILHVYTPFYLGVLLWPVESVTALKRRRGFVYCSRKYHLFGGDILHQCNTFWLTPILNSGILDHVKWNTAGGYCLRNNVLCVHVPHDKWDKHRICGVPERHHRLMEELDRPEIQAIQPYHCAAAWSRGSQRFT